MWDMRKHILEQKEILDRLLRRRDDAEKQVGSLMARQTVVQAKKLCRFLIAQQLSGSVHPI